ncbi:hypothetical protein SALBM311S_01370 [Streptomyces alboniger]
MLIRPPSPRAPTGSEARADVVCVGETMAVLSPWTPACSRTRERWRSGWAERSPTSPARWPHSGTAPPGWAAWATTRSDVVSWKNSPRAAWTSAASRQTRCGRPGCTSRTPARTAPRTYYYRRGLAAASGMGTGLARTFRAAPGPGVHLSGVTAAISDTCARAGGGTAPRPRRRHARPGRLLRRQLPPSAVARQSPRATGGPVLRELARGADLVFVGRDEAERLWGTRTAQDVRDLLGPVPVRGRQGRRTRSDGVRRRR